MTCIVSYITDGGDVWMGADSASSNGFEIGPATTEKVFLKGDWLIGGSGSWRMNQILRHQFNPPKPKGDLERQVVVDIIPALRTLLKGAGFLKVENEEEEAPNIGILLGTHGRVFCLQSDLSVPESARPYDTVGSGSYHALAAMMALEHYKMAPQTRITRALEIAAELVTTVCGPFTVLSTPAQG